MVQLYSPPAARGLTSRLQGGVFEERSIQRIWNVRLQYNAADTGVAELLSKCPQTLAEVVSKEAELVQQAATQVRALY